MDNFPHVRDAIEWAEDVCAEKIVAGTLVRAAAARQLADLERWSNGGPYEFDAARAERVCTFIELMPHIKGKWARTRERIRLERWQSFVICTVFGWINGAGMRRFRETYMEVARKNAKSTISAPVGLYMLAEDNEPGAEVYSGATTRDQAKIIFGIARHMALREPGFCRKWGVDVQKHSIYRENEASWFQPLSADADTLEGKNPSAGLIDETHVHRNSEVIDVLRTAQGSREQPILWQVTTAGVWEPTSPYVREHNYARSVVEGAVDDEQQFTFIAAAEREDDWFERDTWIKANPNLGVSVFEDYIASLAKKAASEPSFTNEFLRKHLNIPTEQITRWLSVDAWRDCGADVPESELAGMPFWGGLDLSTTRDLTAWVLVFWPDDGPVVVPRFFVPEDTIARRSKEDRVPYDEWRHRGHLIATPGNVVDYDFVRATIRADAERFKLVGLGYDPYMATSLALKLQDEDGLHVEEFRQGWVTMNEPIMQLERLITMGALRHNRNPVLAWCMSNAVLRLDASSNRRFDKNKAVERIDGAVALAMALGMALRTKETPPSKYETEELLIL